MVTHGWTTATLRWIGVCVVVCGLATVRPASASTITFDSAATDLTHYEEGGLTFNLYTDAHFVPDGVHGGFTLNMGTVADVLIFPTAGGTFSVTSFYFLGGLYTHFRGFHTLPPTGGLPPEPGLDIELGGLAGTVYPPLYSSGWSNITFVDWCGYCQTLFGAGGGIDNLNADLPGSNTSVPEPASLVLLAGPAAAAAIKGWRVRRQRNRSA